MDILFLSSCVKQHFDVHGDPTDMRKSTSVFQIRTMNRSNLDKRQVSVIDSRELKVKITFYASFFLG